MEKINEVKVTPINKPTPEIGIDTERTFENNILNAAQIGTLDISSIDALSQSAQNREQSFEIIDSMARDTVISAVLETYAEDTVQTNDKGQIMWVESDDSKILDYISWLLESLNVDKHLYQWAYCLITYGDIYLRLFRNSDVDEDKLFKTSNQKNNRIDEAKKAAGKSAINEEARLRIYASDDKYISYVQMVDNPGEMFDLQKFGKTHGYIKAPVRVIQPTVDELYSYLTRYKMKEKDVEIFDAMSFVHGCLENTSQRQPETVDIYLDEVKNVNDVEEDVKDSMTCSYNVKRGQSILYNAFRNWRELNLLEMSALLNRLTKSAVTRVVTVDVGDMPKEQVRPFMRRLKEQMEQKSAINAGSGMSEYTNPAPIENTIYVPVHGTQGNITATTIGGDFDPKSLVDIEYFRDKLFGALKVPKQYFGFTEDGAGFNGGTSLTILSSRYGKSIKNIQNILCQMITDLLNLFLIDRNLDNYVNKFKVRMQEPITQEEIDKRANNDTRIRYVNDLMGQLTDIDDKATKLKIFKSLLGDLVGNPEVIGYIQDYIDTLEKAAKPETPKNDASDNVETPDMDIDTSKDDLSADNSEELPSFESVEKDVDKDILLEKNTDDEIDDDSYLPTPDELSIDMTDSEKK